MNARDLIKARYARIRASLVARNGSLHNFPPLEEVNEAEWDKDMAYLAKQREGRSFTFTRITSPEGTEESVATGTVDYWTEVLSGETFEVRPATEEEVVDFVLSGGIEDEDRDDAEFQKGWDSYEAS